MADSREKDPKLADAADPGATPRGEQPETAGAADPGVRGEQQRGGPPAPEAPAPTAEPEAEQPAKPPRQGKQDKQQKKDKKGKQGPEGKERPEAEPEGPPPEPAPRPRLLEHYEQRVRAKLAQQFGLGNAHEIPKLVKIVLNVGMGDAPKNPKGLEAATAEPAAITGQHPVATTPPAPCCASSACPSGAKPRSPSTRGPLHGEEGLDREGQAETEVQGARLLPVPTLRPQSRHAAQVQAVPHLFPRSRAARGDSRRAQSQLVTGRKAR